MRLLGGKSSPSKTIAGAKDVWISSGTRTRKGQNARQFSFYYRLQYEFRIWAHFGLVDQQELNENYNQLPIQISVVIRWTGLPIVEKLIIFLPMQYLC